MNLETQLKECDDLYEKQDFRGLIKKCDEILEEYPDNQNAMGYKGFSHYALGDYDKALKILKKGVELYPNNYYFKNNLAMVYYELGEYETSLKLCEDGLEIKDFDWLCENKFKNLIRLGRYDEAIEFKESSKHHLFQDAIFMKEDMAEHELNYYYALLKNNPDDFYIIEMVKFAASKLNVTPDVGDYYLKWIDDIRHVNNVTHVCPDCGGELIPILRGYPSPDALEKAQRGEIHLGGCVIIDNTNYHCKDCQHEFNIEDEDIHIECDNPKLKEYIHTKIFSLHDLLKKDLKKGVKLDEIRKEVLIADDKEFDAFINHLVEIKYVTQPKKGYVKLVNT